VEIDPRAKGDPGRQVGIRKEQCGDRTRLHGRRVSGRRGRSLCHVRRLNGGKGSARISEENKVNK
jgi:hypothetical protein